MKLKEYQRYTDAPGVAVNHERDRLGFAERLCCAEAGNYFYTRGDILEREFDTAQQITWQKVMTLLEHSGILSPDPTQQNRFYIHKAVSQEPVLDGRHAISIINALIIT